MLISLRVLIFLAARDLQSSLNSSSGHTGIECKHECILIISISAYSGIMLRDRREDRMYRTGE